MLALLIAAQVTVFMNGNALLGACRDAPNGYCLGYIIGVSDSLDSLSGAGTTKKFVCSPEHATAEQIRDVVIKWLQENPARRASDGAGLVSSALLQAFPCN